MQITTFSVAVLALTVSLLSLSWQIFSFRLSGRRIRTYASIGWVGIGNQLVLQSIKKSDDPLDLLSQISGLGPSTAVLGVTIHNVGRSDLYVSSVFIVDASGSNTYFPAASAGWPTLPCLLKSGDSENWYLKTSEFKDICDNWNMPNGTKGSRLEMRVTLKDGRKIVVRRRLRLEELQKIWNVSKLGNIPSP